jgi:nitrogen fixation/metabolism regulation signal transduction histidine kinase
MNRHGVGQKLGMGFAIVIGLMLLQGFASISAMRTLSSALDRSVKKIGESSAQLNGIQATLAGMKDFTKMTQFAYSINVKLDQKAASDCLMCHTLPDGDAARREFATMADGVHSKIKALAAAASSAEEKQALDRLDRSTTDWSAVFGGFIAKASARQFVEAHSTTVETMEPIIERMVKEVHELETIEARNMVRSQAETAAAVKQKVFLMFGLQAVILLPAIFFGWRFTRRLGANLRGLGRAASCLAAGDADAALRQLTAVGL